MPRSREAASHPPADPVAAVATLYRRYAVALLAVTLLLGVWMRAMLAWPRFASGIPFRHLVHAHSHVGFFGWLVLGIAAAIVPRAATVARVPTLRRIAHAIAAASIVALVAFAWEGYGPIAIVVSAVHVLLWIALVRQLWPLGAAERCARPWLRIALVGLCVAGASTLLPGFLAARGVESGWLRELGIELFLDLFVFGWTIAAAIGLAYATVRPPRGSRLALALFALGVVPSACLYVPGAPGAFVAAVGRVGVALVGAALVLVARDLLVHRAPALVSLAAVAMAVVGGLQLLAAAGVGGALLHGRPIVLAFVHLTLLGVATQVLLATSASGRRLGHGVGVVLLAAGGALMLLMLVAMGWPWLAVRATAAGIDVMRMLVLASVGGAIAAAGALILAIAPAAHTSPGPVTLRRVEVSLS